jgi:subtilisin family serine protease
MMKPKLDVSVPDILADQVWNTAKYSGVHDSSGKIVDGSGVIIGVADSGIDYSHGDFYFPNGTSKILYIWDQSTAGKTPDGQSYGNECGPSDIQSKTCTEFDDGGSSLVTGHGTAVAAVAASSGQASHQYYGVAPGASIVAVKLIDASESHVIDAMHYMITKARQLDRPLVIVHSLGDSLGSHDGTEPLELAFTDFVSQGTPIVVASGNDGSSNLHVSGILSPGKSVQVPWVMPTTTNTNQIDLWYPVSTLVGLSVVTPRGEVVTGPTLDFGEQTLDGTVIIQAHTRPSGREWWINITNAQTSSSRNLWSFVLSSVSGAEGKWDAWTEPGQFVGSNDTEAGRYLIDRSDTIDAPGTARGVITVGAYMSKYSWWAHCTTCAQWAKANGYMGYWWTPSYAPGESQLLYFNTSKGVVKTILVGGPGVGQLLYFSSAGPTRDGRMKPELDAPGANIATARASSAPQRHSDPDNYHQVWVGTSFAAPHVGGTIALMLQMNPYLTPNEITSILKRDARQDNFTGNINNQTGSPFWGWGKLNALSSTTDAPNLYSVRVQVQSVGKPFSVKLSLDGETVYGLQLNSTNTRVLEFARGGSHIIQLTPIINVEPGVRYALYNYSWIFSTGGTRTFIYQEQFYLQVNSQYGSPSGTGWYDANSTASVSITPTTVDGHQFQGWIGANVSSSPAVTVKMDSSKEISATWNQNGSFAPLTLLAEGVVILMVATVILAFIKLRYLGKRHRQHPSAA